MFDFFQGNYTARDSLRDWQDKNHPWLELTDVHRETTENMRVTVMPFYIGSRVSITSKLAFKSLTIVNEQQNTKIVIQNILVSACVHTHTQIHNKLYILIPLQVVQQQHVYWVSMK